jgi:AcrR family transcriptional regulator
MDRADIQRAALSRFAAQGYHATTMRHLTQDLGVTPGAFYYHFKNKDELLTSLIEDILTRDLELLHTIKRENDRNPLDEMIYAHVYGICHAREEALIVEREAKCLTEGFRNRVARMTHEYERIFADQIAEEYDLSGDELTLATRAVMGLGGSVVQWFRQGGPLGEHEVAVAFTRYARGILERAERDAAAVTLPRQHDSTRNGSGPMSFENTTARIKERVAARRQAQKTSAAS